MVVAPIDNGHIDRRRPERARGAQAGEAAPDDHNVALTAHHSPSMFRAAQQGIHVRSPWRMCWRRASGTATRMPTRDPAANGQKLASHRESSEANWSPLRTL